MNENTLEEVVGIHVSKLNGLSVLLTVCLIIFIIAACILVFTPLRNYLPGYMNSDLRRQVVTNALRADSLADALERQNRYIINIQDILRGEVKVDTVQSIDSLNTLRAEELAKRTQLEEDFNASYIEFGAITQTIKSKKKVVEFIPPVEGNTTRKFGQGEHSFGIRIETGKPSVVAVAEGTVVFAGLTSERGYVIHVQHADGYMSIYTNCELLLKKVGEHVIAGEIIASTGKGERSRFIEFELWHDGVAMDPEKYMPLKK